VEAEAPWIGADVWFGCASETAVETSALRGRRCWGGLDLSSTQDLTALALIFEPSDADPLWRLKVWFWLPGDGLHDKADRDRVPYIAWRDAGHLEALPGRAINKLAVIRRLSEIASLYDLQEVAYDRWRIEDLKMLLDQEGISLPLVPFGQGFKDMAPAIDEFERLLLGGQLKHEGNPVMTWCAANAVTMSDPAGNRKIAKEKATGRVDGIVAAVMAVGRAMSGGQQENIDDFINDPVTA
jgi:phage terminase large subunit-like protein